MVGAIDQLGNARVEGARVEQEGTLPKALWDGAGFVEGESSAGAPAKAWDGVGFVFWRASR